ncbi:uncharacterized protein CMC5_017990 [Chondromyces crocatus]|uniref:Uncharacterized protein n=2 Tax=Chondromyces crocatus TaxID=52 RepID=A0A0K1EAG2_CHOCO|nr:uncharacterized protein CMC5_017990 [Chondromyces crocatus]
MVLAAAGVLGTAAVAHAQQPAPPAPPPAPAPTTPSAPGAAPAAPVAGGSLSLGLSGSGAAGSASATGSVGAQAAPGAAGAQQPPQPDQPNPPVETPPATEEVTPPAPAAPAQPDAPGAAAPVVEEAPAAPPAPNRWAGTLINWNQSATTTIFGVGADVIGRESENYLWAFSFVPGYMIHRDPVNQLRVSSVMTLRWDLTDNNFSARERDVDVNDIPLRLTYTRTLYSGGGGTGAASAGAAAARDPTLAGGGEYKTWGIVSGGIDLPTSRWSRYQGRYMTTSLGAGARQMVKLLGSDADGLNNIFFTLSGTWQHQFNRASTATYSDLNIPRQTAGGTTGISDQLTGGALVQDQIITSFSFFMPIYGNLQLNGLAQLWSQFPSRFESSGCEAQTLTGCVTGSRMENRTSLRALTMFDVSLAYQVLPELLVDIGYNNTAFQIGEDGQRRNVFYSPIGSTFYADVTVTLDQLYKRFASKPAQPKVGRVAR